MNISTSISNPSFEARIKLRTPNVKQLAQSAIGTAALGTASVAAAELGVSVAAITDNQESVLTPLNESIPNLGETPKKILKSHQNFLTSAGGKYDAAGYVEGIPVQSSFAPSASAASSIYTSSAGINAWNAASGDNIQATAYGLGQGSKLLSANKSAQKSILGSSYFGTAAASLYTGFNSDVVNNTLPASIKFTNYEQEQLEDMSMLTGGLSASAPISIGSGELASMISNTKSSQFVSDTVSGNKTDKKMPS